MIPPQPRGRSDFEIALICALQIEADAIHATFDLFWADEGVRYGQAAGDDNAYTTGVIGGHNVVLAYMPGMGKVSASAVSVALRNSFPSIKLALVAGICGGVPYSNKNQTRIYLGDLIISTALVQYDFGKQYPSGHRRKDTLTDTLGRASPKIRAFLNKLETRHYRRSLQKNIAAILDTIGQDDPYMRCPGADKDVLYQSGYVHQHRPSSDGSICNTCDLESGMICTTALGLSCIDLGCEAQMLDCFYNSTIPRDSYSPVVHFGRMGSADTVMKSGLHRDIVAESDGVIGFEMEGAGAGVWDQLPSIVIKSACDYADSHKSKIWQSYAAAVAAAGVKAFLMEWNPSDHLPAQKRLLPEIELSLRENMNNRHDISSYNDGNSHYTPHFEAQHQQSGQRRRTDEPESNLNEREDEAILASLSFHGMSERRNNIETQHRKTCTWIFGLEEYKNWQNQSSGLLWIKGKPGAGKSTLMLFLYDTFCRERRPDGNFYLDFFFSARGNELQRTPLGMLRSLLNQLFCKDSCVRDKIRKSYLDKHTFFGGVKHSWTWQRRELEALLIEAIMLSSQQQLVTIFIDALDEAGERAAREMAQYYHDMIERTSEVSGRVKICISCRHYPIVSRYRGNEVCVEEYNHADIAAFVYDRLHIESAPVRDLSPVDSWHSLADDLVDQARGIFQWVYLVLPMIEKSYNDGESLEVCRQRLREVPEELGDVYKYIIEKVINKQDRDRSFHLFQWVCLAERPLSVTEIRFAMATMDVATASFKTKCCNTARFVKTDELMARQIRALSGGLIETEVVVEGEWSGTRVQVIHQSVNDFLQSRGLRLLFNYQSETSTVTSMSEIPSSGLDVVRLCHENLYHCCLNYLATEDSKTAIRELEKSSIRVANINFSPGLSSPLIVYAAINLFVHAAKSVGSRTKSVEEEVRLLESVVNPWTGIYRACFMDPHRPEIGTTVIHAAAAANLIDVVQYLVHSKTNIEVRDRFGYTALHLAARNGHLSMVELLVFAGSSIGIGAEDGQTPLMLAAGNGHLEIIEFFFGHDASADLLAGGSGFALQEAAEGGNAMAVRYLISAGANLDDIQGYRGTALQIASYKGFEEIVEILLVAGANVNTQGGYYGNPLQAASFQGYKKIVQTLLMAGADVNARGGDCGAALHAASWPGNEKTVQTLLRAGADVNLQWGKYDTALQAAVSSSCATRYLEVVRILLEAGANVNLQGGEYGNALQAASHNGYDKAVQILLGAGADVNAQGGRFGAAIHAASHHGHKNIVQILLEAEADINLQVGYWDTALQAASHMGHLSWLDDIANVKLVKMLLDAGADVNLQGGHYGTALQAASAHGHDHVGYTEVVQLLLEAGADVNAGVGFYRSALQAAACEGNKEVFCILLAAGADIDSEGEGSGSRLRSASYHGHEKVVQTLLEAGIDANHHDGVFDRPIYSALYDQHKRVVQLLLDAGAKFDWSWYDSQAWCLPGEVHR